MGGARVGIMISFASLNAITPYFWIARPEFQRLPLSRVLSICICNTMVKHEHAEGIQ